MPIQFGVARNRSTIFKANSIYILAHNTEVRVRDKQTQEEITITYKAFQDVAYKFDLLGQIENGQLVEGDPNLQPQHQRKRERNAAVGNVGPQPTILTPEEIEAKKQEMISKIPGLQIKAEPQKEEAQATEPEKQAERTKRPYKKRIKESAE